MLKIRTNFTVIYADFRVFYEDFRKMLKISVIFKNYVRQPVDNSVEKVKPSA